MSEMEPEDWKQIFDYYGQENEFYSWLNVNVENIDEGYCEMTIPKKEKYYIPNVASDDWVHGGVIASLIDILAVPTAYTLVGSDKYVATQDLSIEFIKKAQGELKGESYVSNHNADKNRLDVEIEVMDTEQEFKVAHGSAKIVYGESDNGGL